MLSRLLVLCVVLLGCETARPPAPEAAAAEDPVARARRSAGCGKAARGSGEFVTRTLQVDDMARTLHLRLPKHYDPQHAYALIFRWHGTGGDGLSGGLGIEAFAGEQALVVAADGLEKRWGPFEKSRNIALFDAMYRELTQRYCIDLGRVFSYGFSAGGGLSNELACIRGDVLRGAAGIASRPSSATCNGPTAALFMHDENDDVVPFSQGTLARDHALAQNGCSATGRDVGDDCIRYEGCAEGEPVLFCRSRGLGHEIRGDFAPQRVWRFFRSLF